MQLANGLRNVSSHDRAGRLISLMQANASGQPLATTTYDYDADGRLRHRTDPTGVEHWMLYDDASRLVGEIDGKRSLVEYVYDRNNQVVQTIRYATPVAGALPASRKWSSSITVTAAWKSSACRSGAQGKSAV